MQWIVFFVAALLLSSALRHVPGIGEIFGGIWGFWIAVMLLSALASRLSSRLMDSSRIRRKLSELGRVDNPHNQGKLGTMLLLHHRVRAATPALERAVAGEPESAEWHYRLGSALRAGGEHQRAAAELESALKIAPAHAYGEVAIELVLARKAQGDFAGALAALETCERQHGETVRSAYLRGSLLARLGQRDKARAAYQEVSDLTRRLPHFSRRGTMRWRALAWLARMR
ncbi:MAG TPA: tetratricopeptide repeat protein [Planctomycetota bacterium]|nr:tetratricopeptide repeat protein [Planctomycetota bacterium]